MYLGLGFGIGSWVGLEFGFGLFWVLVSTVMNYFGRIALYGSTELTLPYDSTHPPDCGTHEH